MRRNGLVHGWGINMRQDARHLFQRHHQIMFKVGEPIDGEPEVLGQGFDQVL